jgi:hypothetical protein
MNRSPRAVNRPCTQLRPDAANCMTVTGKVQKFRMREISIVELGLEDVARIETA